MEPDTSIMDMVNNIEPLYNDLQGLFRRWEREHEAGLWDERDAMKQALALAAHFAEAIEGDKDIRRFKWTYTKKDFQEAADDMIEEFKSNR